MKNYIDLDTDTIMNICENCLDGLPVDAANSVYGQYAMNEMVRWGLVKINHHECGDFYIMYHK